MKTKSIHKHRKGVYMIINLVNNKVYVGYSVNIAARINAHRGHLNRRDRKHENEHFINEWHEHGEVNFDYSVLEYIENDEVNVKDREAYWMSVYESTNIDKGYNLRVDTSDGMKVHKDTLVRMSEARTKFFENPENVAKFREQQAERHARFMSDPEKVKSMAKAVSKAKRIYIFTQLTRDGEFVAEYESIEAVIAANPTYKWQNIYSVCNGYKPTIYGYVWRKKLKI